MFNKTCRILVRATDDKATNILCEMFESYGTIKGLLAVDSGSSIRSDIIHLWINRKNFKTMMKHFEKTDWKLERLGMDYYALSRR